MDISSNPTNPFLAELLTATNTALGMLVCCIVVSSSSQILIGIQFCQHAKVYGCMVFRSPRVGELNARATC